LFGVLHHGHCGTSASGRHLFLPLAHRNSMFICGCLATCAWRCRDLFPVIHSLLKNTCNMYLHRYVRMYLAFFFFPYQFPEHQLNHLHRCSGQCSNGVQECVCVYMCMCVRERKGQWNGSLYHVLVDYHVGLFHAASLLPSKQR
jgi:hypothetical protein